MGLDVEWDPEKAEQNQRRHGISFEEALTVLADPLSTTMPDPDHSERESRMLLFGCARTGRYLIVSLTLRGDAVRLISARVMTSRERRNYERSLEP
ncbi:MAG TPA: BrnT family toxin [Longimicrobium sp.]|nr:BrnT family toxin [Longimicrobium sp.]